LQELLVDLATLFSVIWLDIALAADNAIAVGLAASALPARDQKRVVLAGIGLALVLRIAFALVAVQLMNIPGVLLVGGLLLFWVAYRMWEDLRTHAATEQGAGVHKAEGSPATFMRALTSVVIADVSMSLDNVLSVAAIARHSPAIMAFGLIVSVLLMGVAASFIATLINKHRWIAWAGMVVIILAGIRMVWEDGHHFFPTVIPGLPGFLQPPHPPA
jgi:YjbE family integral membrane protein